MRIAARASEFEHENESAKADAFMNELSELSQKHGIGLAGEITLFVMDRDEDGLQYHCDKESRVTLS
jgi:hypothetical protein